MDTPVRKAKILATLGPASRDQGVIESLILAGANGVRINMSHGTHEEKTEDIKKARDLLAKAGYGWDSQGKLLSPRKSRFLLAGNSGRGATAAAER